MLYACDLRWWVANRPSGADKAPSVWCTQDKTAAHRYGLAQVAGRVGAGLCLEPWVVHLGMNSGYQAINLAYHLGASRILLVGFDMQRTYGMDHWFGPHKGDLKVRSPLEEFAKRFGPLAADLRAQKIDVVNCSIETALTCFPRGEIQAELRLL